MVIPCWKWLLIPGLHSVYPPLPTRRFNFRSLKNQYAIQMPVM
ncbi:hypothetical protein COLO4_06402 [Corchorus olitorius]|uniref:Uncharacterized protein n=1 Tax=Corchorus olitorius TaxID=93759 RepID=A0A1R3KN68_9ROSI|nr:hypothetical protein COLO4_06402 [Corchorus olitorius]